MSRIYGGRFHFGGIVQIKLHRSLPLYGVVSLVLLPCVRMETFQSDKTVSVPGVYC